MKEPGAESIPAFQLRHHDLLRLLPLSLFSLPPSLLRYSLHCPEYKPTIILFFYMIVKIKWDFEWQAVSVAMFNRRTTKKFKTCDTWLFTQEHWPLFPLGYQKEITTANTVITFLCEWMKIIPMFYQISKKCNTFFGVSQNFRN